MNINPFRYLRNTLTPLDRLRGFKTRDKLKIGWCGVFPPYQNGAAAVSYYTVRELLKRNDLELALIPLNNKITKRMFKGAVFCRLDNPHLDAVVFWCLGAEYKKYASQTKAKKIVWQTIHHGYDTKTDNEQLHEVEGADLKIFMTEWAADLNGKMSKGRKERIAYIPYGIDTRIFKPAGKKAFEVIFVSRNHYYKGLMPLLDSIPIVLKSCPDVIFRVYAPFDRFSPYIDEIKEAVKTTKENYPNNFFFDHSWRNYDDMLDIYKLASILVFPSNNEGFGVPLIEAMSCGIPCIVSDIPPLNEIVTPETGFLMPMRKDARYHGLAFPSPEQIADRIIFLRKDKNAIRIMQVKCRKHVKKNYELKEVIGKLVKTIKREALCVKLLKGIK